MAEQLDLEFAPFRLDVGGRTRFDAEAPPGFDLLTGAWGVGAWDGAAVFGGLRATPLR